MKSSTVYGVVVGAVLGASAVGLVATTWGQPTKEAPKAPGHEAAKPEMPKDMQMSEEQMMAEMVKLSAPGEQHKALAKFAGTWHGKVSNFNPETGKPDISEGTMVNTLVLEGRWLHQDWSGSYMKVPFKGIGYWGYDNAKHEYVGMWTDTMSTNWSVMKGQYDAATKSYTSTGVMDSPMGQVPMREVTTVIDADHHTFDMYMSGPDGKEVKAMTIEYSRK